MIDSGAAGNFMSFQFANKANLKTKLRNQPISVVFADRRRAEITHCTYPLSVNIDGHSEFLIFDIIPSLNTEVILGLPWLKTHDPEIKWREGSIKFTNCDCQEEFNDGTDYEDDLVYCDNISTINDDCHEVEDGTILMDIPEELREFIDVFSKSKAETLPSQRSYDCKIDLVDPLKLPPLRPIYTLSEIEKKALKDYIKEMLSIGFIRSSNSPVGAPIFFVNKKDKTLRPCVDFRELNEATVKDRFPLPLISDLFDRVSNARYFSKIDLRGAYNLIRIKEGDEWKTSFRSCYGQFEYLVMPFGLANAPSIFQRMMQEIFADMWEDYVMIYLDDILIFSESLEDHIQQVKKVLQRLRENKLYAKQSKCEFFKEKIEFLGFILSSRGKMMAPSKVASISGWPKPNNKKDIQRFLGLANFYRRFVKNYSYIVAPLTALTRKEHEFCWNKKENEAFDRIKSLITTAPILSHFDPDRQIRIETDASDFAIGACLSQPTIEDSKDYRPVCFYSRKLLPAEQNYHVHDKELLAIVDTLDYWRPYLLGSKFKLEILCDHRNLTFFRQKQLLRPRHARWSLFLEDYWFTLSYRPGSENTLADALSRRPDYEPINISDNNEGRIVILPEHIWLNTINNEKITVTNPKEQRIIMEQRHDSMLSGHLGRTKTFELIAKDFFWPKMRSEIYKYVDSCDVCQRIKSARHKPYGLLQPVSPSAKPWSDLSMDFIVKLPKSKTYDSILVIVCRFTKMAHFIACNETITSDQLAKLFFDNVIKYHGLPSTIISDRGPVFRSQFWSNLLKFIKIKANLSTAFHPESDGQTERVNQTLEQYLRAFVNYKQDNWSELLSFAEFAYNNAPSSTTGMSPFFANFGYHPKQDYLINENDLKEIENLPTLKNHFENLEVVNEIIKKALNEASLQMKRYSDVNRMPSPFKEGDMVWLLNKNISTKRPNKKLDHRRFGPFLVTRNYNNTSYQLKLPETMRIHPVFHASLLERVNKHTRSSFVPTPVIINSFQEFAVEEILDVRTRRKQTQYLIRWEGCGPSDDTWEPSKNLTNCNDLMKDFHSKRSGKMKT